MLASWFEGYPESVEVAELYAPRQPVGEIELLEQQPKLEPMDAPLRIHVPRPPPAAYTASHPRDLDDTRVPRGFALPRTLRRYTQRLPPRKVPSPPPRATIPLMLHRKLRGPVGQTPRNQPTFTRIEDLQALPENVSPTKRSTQKVDERDMWKQKYLVQSV